MANLKGGTFEKQIKDGFHRLEAFGVGRFGKNDNRTHSYKLGQKRLMFLKDVATYFNSQHLEGKLNTLMTKDNLDKFFNQRLEALAPITKINYLRSFSSMLNGMLEQNIYIPLHYEDTAFFDDRVKTIKDQYETIIENRYIDNVDLVIQNLYEDRAISGLIAQCQYDLSIRQAEAFELVSNPLKYIENGYIENLNGKGNHIYEAKPLSFELEQKLLNNQDELISKSTYYYDLQKVSSDISSHDFRFTSARDKFEEKMKSGISEKEAKLQISEILNHKREAITDYYLKRSE